MSCDNRPRPRKVRRHNKLRPALISEQDLAEIAAATGSATNPQARLVHVPTHGTLGISTSVTLGVGIPGNEAPSGSISAAVTVIGDSPGFSINAEAGLGATVSLQDADSDNQGTGISVSVSVVGQDPVPNVTVTPAGQIMVGVSAVGSPAPNNAVVSIPSGISATVSLAAANQVSSHGTITASVIAADSGPGTQVRLTTTNIARVTSDDNYRIIASTVTTGRWYDGDWTGTFWKFNHWW